ncbi:MAG: M48 family metallopeptidase [Lachnospiraceae bacterium]|nr:M48 family metallopeptidase [Lachnospiraceae bacterium]
MSKQIKWKGYDVEITKKQVKNLNFRIKPSEPNKIYISIPLRASYDDAMKLLDDPRVKRMLEKQEKNVGESKSGKADWYEKQKPYMGEYSKRLEALLPDMFVKWQKNLGVRAAKITIKDTRSQWGSCNVKNHNISISVWLGAFPEECIEYVVVHELVHLLERGHNARFYGYLDQYYPEWKTCERKLKNIWKS